MSFFFVPESSPASHVALKSVTVPSSSPVFHVTWHFWKVLVGYFIEYIFTWVWRFETFSLDDVKVIYFWQGHHRRGVLSVHDNQKENVYFLKILIEIQLTYNALNKGYFEVSLGSWLFGQCASHPSSASLFGKPLRAWDLQHPVFRSPHKCVEWGGRGGITFTI